MSEGIRYPREYARVIGEALIHDLQDLCSKIEISGSIRRNKDLVGDVEVVCLPTATPVEQPGLFDDKEKFDSELIKLRVSQMEWCRPRLPTRMGDRFMALENAPNVPEGYNRRTNIPIDLFVVLPPATWGVIQTIRTGPAEYSKSLMERAIAMEMRVKDGALFYKKYMELIPTPDELDFYNALELQWVEPKDRS